MAKALKIFFGKKKVHDREAWYGPSVIQGLQSYIYADPEKTLTYFMARSKFLKIAYCAYTRLRSQVSVYMTIDYLVYMRTRRLIGRQTL